MKKIFLSLIFSIGILFSMSSCISSAYAQDVIVEDDGVGVSMGVVVRYGTPYYFEGSVLYYLYNGWYYYPYLTGNGYYLYRYSRPLPPPRHGYRFEPRPGDRPHIIHHRPYGSMRSSTRHVERRPAVRNERPRSEQRGFGNQPRTNPQPQRGNVGRPAPQVRNNGGSVSRPAPQVRGGSAPSTRGGAPSGGGRGSFGGRR